jgi:hypothetical protein
MKKWNYSFYLLSALPIFFCLSFLSYSWLTSGPPDKALSYSDSGVQFLDQLIMISLIGSFWCFWAMPVLVAAYLIFNRKNIVWLPVLICIASYVVAAFVFYSDAFVVYLD